MKNFSDSKHPMPQHLQEVKRCGAKTRQGGSCQQPGMKNGRCRLHGGKSTGPKTPEGKEKARMAPFKHGFYSAEARAARRESAQWMKMARASLGPNLL